MLLSELDYFSSARSGWNADPNFLSTNISGSSSDSFPGYIGPGFNVSRLRNDTLSSNNTGPGPGTNTELAGTQICDE